jgi:hypothetical protein
VVWVAALLSVLANKPRVGFLRVIVTSVATAFLLLPPLVGSFCIAFALNHLAGGRLGTNGIGFVGVGLWAVLLSVVWMAILRRTTMHG